MCENLLLKSTNSDKSDSEINKNKYILVSKNRDWRWFNENLEKQKQQHFFDAIENNKQVKFDLLKAIEILIYC